MKTNEDEIILIALEAGFMISTMHGQDESKLMPVSDKATLMKFAELLKGKDNENK